MNQTVISITKSGEFISSVIVNSSSTGSINQTATINREMHELTEDQLNRILAIIRE